MKAHETKGSEGNSWEEETFERNIRNTGGGSHRRPDFTYGESEWEGDDHPMFEDGLQGEPSTREGLRTRDLTVREPLQRFEEQPAQSIGGKGVKKIPIKPRGQWSNKALIAGIDALDDGYKMQDMSNNFGIPRSTLRKESLERLGQWRFLPWLKRQV